MTVLSVNGTAIHQRPRQEPGSHIHNHQTQRSPCEIPIRAHRDYPTTPRLLTDRPSGHPYCSQRLASTIWTLLSTLKLYKCPELSCICLGCSFKIWLLPPLPCYTTLQLLPPTLIPKECSYFFLQTLGTCSLFSQMASPCSGRAG